MNYFETVSPLIYFFSPLGLTLNKQNFDYLEKVHSRLISKSLCFVPAFSSVQLRKNREILQQRAQYH